LRARTVDMVINGFSYAAARGGIRGKDRLDIGLIFCDGPATAAGVFTTSRVKAAPVVLDMERVARGRARAILVNSGIANACTGRQGDEKARAAASLAAATLGVDEELVLVASTGVIGMQLELASFEKVMAGLVADLAPDRYEDVARAMMTTDTVPKVAASTVTIDGRQISFLGLAKGAGMIMPHMATMLCFVMTDVAVSAPVLQTLLTSSTNRSFNRITVDGDTSTNDTVLVLANGRAGNATVNAIGSEACQQLQEALDGLLLDLALQLVADGEGATKLVTIQVEGATSDLQAEQAARTVANSSLVKTAFFGEDANWGRIIAALGRSGAEFDPDRVDIAFDDVKLVQDGLGQGESVEAQATRVLKKPRFTVTIDLKAGSGSSAVYTCDLSLDYVKINADYRS
jgi:glutamate N-acetyltransferase/amino-acid N-acetyltransferase